MSRKLGLQWPLRKPAETAAVAGATWQQPATLGRNAFGRVMMLDHSSSSAQVLRAHDTFPESLQCRRKTVKEQYILQWKVSRDTRANITLAIIF